MVTQIIRMRAAELQSIPFPSIICTTLPNCGCAEDKASDPMQRKLYDSIAVKPVDVNSSLAENHSAKWSAHACSSAPIQMMSFGSSLRNSHCAHWFCHPDPLHCGPFRKAQVIVMARAVKHSQQSHTDAVPRTKEPDHPERKIHAHTSSRSMLTAAEDFCEALWTTASN